MPPSNAKPIEIPGYFFDPQKNRYFKALPNSFKPELASPLQSTQFHSALQVPQGARGEAWQQQKKQHVLNRSSLIDPYLPLRAHLPARMFSDPELHPGTSASRSKFQSRVQSEAFIRPFNTAITLSIPQQSSDGSLDEITSLLVSRSTLTPDSRQVWIGTRCGSLHRAHLRNISAPYLSTISPGGLFYPRNLAWQSSVTPAPITSISLNEDCYALTGMNGSVSLIVNDCPRLSSDMDNSNAWCSLLTSRFLVYGEDRSVNIFDVPNVRTHREWLTGSSVFALAEVPQGTFLAGTRSGKVFHIDPRIVQTKNDSGLRCLLSKPGSVYHLKYFADENQLLVAGSGNYAAVHDLRYVMNRWGKTNDVTRSEPIMTLAAHRNKCTERLPLASMEDSSLVSLAGDDDVVRIWDLKGNMTPGIGLKPVKINRTTSQANVSQPANPYIWPQRVSGLALFDDWPGRRRSYITMMDPSDSHPTFQAAHTEHSSHRDDITISKMPHKGVGLMVAHGAELTCLSAC